MQSKICNDRPQEHGLVDHHRRRVCRRQHGADLSEHMTDYLFLDNAQTCATSMFEHGHKHQESKQITLQAGAVLLHYNAVRTAHTH